jgi:hypothetical protein
MMGLALPQAESREAFHSDLKWLMALTAFGDIKGIEALYAVKAHAWPLEELASWQVP